MKNIDWSWFSVLTMALSGLGIVVILDSHNELRRVSYLFSERFNKKITIISALSICRIHQ
jgi:hypothetical protein